MKDEFGEYFAGMIMGYPRGYVEACVGGWRIVGVVVRTFLGVKAFTYQTLTRHHDVPGRLEIDPTSLPELPKPSRTP